MDSSSPRPGEKHTRCAWKLIKITSTNFGYGLQLMLTGGEEPQPPSYRTRKCSSATAMASPFTCNFTIAISHRHDGSRAPIASVIRWRLMLPYVWASELVIDWKSLVVFDQSGKSSELEIRYARFR